MLQCVACVMQCVALAQCTAARRMRCKCVAAVEHTGTLCICLCRSVSQCVARVLQCAAVRFQCVGFVAPCCSMLQLSNIPALCSIFVCMHVPIHMYK